jgi:hypothetical protein
MSATQTQPKLTVSQRLAKAENLLMDAGEIISQIKFEAEQQEKGTATTPTPTATYVETKHNQYGPYPATAKPSVTKKVTVEEVKKALPADLVDCLDVAPREQGTVIIIKTTGYLGSDNFSKIFAIIKGLGGEYISAGRDSHFKIKAVQGGN